jgi:hypothetical protein
MPDPSREPSGEVPDPDSRATPDEDESRPLAAAAPGESAPADRLRARLVSDGDPARLRDVLGPEEAPQYLLEGIMADRIPAGGDVRRRMARPGGSVFTLVTDRAVHLVVQYEERLAVDTVPLTAVRGAMVEHAGGETRLEFDAGGERYRVYPSATPAAVTEAAATALDEWSGSASADNPVSSLERLAGLYERGLLTDEEFAAAKRDLFG